MSDTTRPHLPSPPAAVIRRAAPAARGLERDFWGNDVEPQPAPQDESLLPATDDESRPKRETATDAIGRRAGALSDELDFVDFVSSLVQGTFDAIVDSSIRQMESFADLVSAVAKPVDQFTQENVSANQARDFLVEQYPQDLALVRGEDGPRVVPRPNLNEDGEDAGRSPSWLADYGLGGEELSPEVVEEMLVPKARERVAKNRLQTLATMVLLGMNRVVVRDGTIGARLRFRAAAADHTLVDYAVSDDGGQEPPSTEWGRRGSRSYASPRTKVSTVGVNVQSDSDLKAELFGDVKINFASETVPLERFIDDARRTVLERHARPPADRAPVSSPPATTGPATPPALPGVTPPQVSTAPAAAPASPQPGTGGGGR